MELVEIRNIDLTNEPAFSPLGKIQRREVTRTLRILQSACRKGQLQPRLIKTILDFGAGDGVTTVAINAFGKAIGAEVVAVEQLPARVYTMRWRKVLPDSAVIEDCGLDYIGRNDNRFDLITACMFGPDNGWLFAQLAKVCETGLSPVGKILLNSDGNTLASVKKVCEDSGARIGTVGSIDDAEATQGRLLPKTLIIPRDELVKIRSAQIDPPVWHYSLPNKDQREYHLFVVSMSMQSLPKY